jgi:phage terminase large subunit-like protein
MQSSQVVSPSPRLIRLAKEEKARRILAARALRSYQEDRRPWREVARDSQLPPEGAWAYWLILAGRGFGKTRAGAELVIEWARDPSNRRIAIVGATAADVRDVMIEGESGIMACSPDDFLPVYEPSKRRLTWPNGVQATTFSAEKPGRLRGPQFHKAWADEPCVWEYVDAWDMLQFGLRLGANPQCVATSTPKQVPLLKLIKALDGIHITRGTTYENRANLAEKFFNEIVKKYEGTRLGRQELEGEELEDVQGALWSRRWIDQARLMVYPTNLVKIVIGVDPSVADPEKRKNPNKDPNACGIVVAAVGDDARGYVLNDLSGVYSPNDWAKIAVGAYSYYKANGIVAEVNQGGQMVEDTIKGVGPMVPVEQVSASLKKRARAEPLSMLYEQGRVSHVGRWDLLEDEMCGWDAEDPTQPSPNRVDALVWAFHGLGLCSATGVRRYSRSQPEEEED